MTNMSLDHNSNRMQVSPLGPRGNGGNPTQYQAGHMFYKTVNSISHDLVPVLRVDAPLWWMP